MPSLARNSLVKVNTSGHSRLSMEALQKLCNKSNPSSFRQGHMCCLVRMPPPLKLESLIIFYPAHEYIVLQNVEYGWLVGWFFGISNCCIPVEGKTTTLLHKNIPLYSSRSQSFCGMWKIDGRTDGNKDRLLYWPITSSSLDYVIFKTPLGTSSASRSAVLNRKPCGPQPQQVLSVTASWHWLTLPPTDQLTGPYRGICIYHFITPTTSNKPRDCFRLFTQVRPVQRHLWLIARQGSVYKKNIVG